VLDLVIEEDLVLVDDLVVLVERVTLEVLVVVLTVLPGARNRKVGLLV
jgi:hypothetical protein